MWQGSAYSAIWSNGATGQLSVESGDASELRVQRLDTSGLSATYTGKWDGKTVSEGKLTYTFKGTSGAGVWTGKPTLTPVLNTPNQDYSFLNWYTAQLTGFAIYTKGPNDSWIGTKNNDFRVRGEPPMKPGESRLFSSRPVLVAPNYVKDAVYMHDEPIAAIYSDGTTFGDPNVVVEMLERRRSIITALTGIGTTLCTLGSHLESVVDTETALDKQHAQEDARSAAGTDERNTAYSFVSKSLSSRESSRVPADRAIKRTFDQLNLLRSGLAADPVRDASGQLTIPPVAPLQCSLP